jgi:hypothetical protein
MKLDMRAVREKVKIWTMEASRDVVEISDVRCG